ncbi:DUF3192 domain-containing protein [Bowmanella dokdonensis]|uniref:DUF3192 domain-containing protein n=1 Tax=Bowmanella dokdonensis TaxID=751969 RepID=A0A939DM83_9ALTE|nr:DUF3192 domain-containing protein [Bowmanella dokdonensis]MBN7824832.1 DUF3192 domain-containing protein [Bowmanella dokdonensis]
MIKRAAPFVLLIPALLGLTGCVISVGGDGYEYQDGDWQHREAKNRKEIARLEPGMSLDNLNSRLGTPDFSEFHQAEQGDIQVLFYRTHRNHGDGVTTKDECTPLVFREGRLVGWGEAAYRDI